MSDQNIQDQNLEFETVEVRLLAPHDLDWVVKIDEEHSGQTRRPYFELKLKEASLDTHVRVSLAATIGTEPVGFLMGRLYYGEFGMPEPVAYLDSIGVSSSAHGKGVGKTLLDKLQHQLRALGVRRLLTEVDWTQSDLISFFRHCGFRAAPRVCLELDVDHD